jgi:uncharacterized protein YqjF (DUF2071 family)
VTPALPGEVEHYEPTCPLRVDHPIMYHQWQTLTFLHWSYDPDIVQRLLPDSLVVETFGGRAWLGLVPFFMRIRPPGIPYLPWISNFCETNVRTYVRDELGNSGVWFFSLDAERLPAVLTARTGFRLPYVWSQMRLARAGSTITYIARRRRPFPPAASRVVVDVDAPYRADELGDLDHFLTARWRLFSVGGRDGRRRRHAPAQHAPWPLHHARVRELDDGLVAAAGLPAPSGEPLVHYSPGVAVKIGRPLGYS